jgi:two-component system sensor histidine kinase KdpD
LNAVSHDLRTPLASIIAAAGSLSQEDVAWSRNDVREFGRAIEGEARRLNRIVGNLLDLSRLRAGALVPQLGWYDLGALVDDVVGRLRPDLAGRAVSLDLASDLPPICLDYVEIDQVLHNLLENAAKYAPAGSPVEIAVRRQPEEVVVEVADRGPGLPPESLARVFEPFFRAGDGEGPKGTGLGLAVARGLVEAHGGRIWAENRAEGGSRFAFTLPLHALADTRSPAPTVQR